MRIDGRPVTLEKGQQNEYFVPLANANADTPFVLELRYTVQGDGSRLDLPSFPQEPAVVKAYLCVYLPETRTLLGVRGPWSEEFQWQGGPTMRRRPWPPIGADRLVQWVWEGVNCPSSPAQDFQTDGQLYVYSTLCPAAGPEGSLEMTTFDRRGLNGLLFAVTVLMGVLLLPARLPARALVVGAAVVALVLAGVFLPTFSMQILNGVLFSAIFIVAVMWSVAMVVRRRGSSGPMAAPPGRRLRLSSLRSRKRRREGRPMRSKTFRHCKSESFVNDPCMQNLHCTNLQSVVALQSPFCRLGCRQCVAAERTDSAARACHAGNLRPLLRPPRPLGAAAETRAAGPRGIR